MAPTLIQTDTSVRYELRPSHDSTTPDMMKAEHVRAIVTGRETLLIHEFVSDGYCHVLKQAVPVIRYFESGYWVYECPRYNLDAYAKDKSEARDLLNDEFAILYHRLVGVDDSKLTRGAITMRDRLDHDVVRAENVGKL